MTEKKLTAKELRKKIATPSPKGFAEVNYDYEAYQGKIITELCKENELLNQIIEIYSRTNNFINKILIETIKTTQNKELLHFAWDINDCLVDQPELQELVKQIEELRKR